MQLSKQILKETEPPKEVTFPSAEIFNLPERVLQFGTGVLLRGLPDYFIDKANRSGIFNGRIVVVKSTTHGDTLAYTQQDGLYTHCLRGMVQGKITEKIVINSSISRVLTAVDNWPEILECAKNPDMRIVISNTTEVGIRLSEDDIRLSPPLSYPGKLLAFLFERFRFLNNSPGSGMIIIPTELITNNGTTLKNIITELAKRNNLGADFLEWLEKENCFCNSLVDRIVPGKMQEKEIKKLEEELGYQDDLMIMSEPFSLWAIESGDERVREALTFADTDPGVVITNDIEKYRELKLRLLNGTHSFSCGLAHLAGFTTVKEAMADPAMAVFIEELASSEIATAIKGDMISLEEAQAYAEQVMDRFRNPYLDHAWLAICAQYSSKMKLRNIPLLIKYSEKTGGIPKHMALGFAAYILFMKMKPDEKGNYEGIANGKSYRVLDDHHRSMTEKWESREPRAVVKQVLADRELWGEDLSLLDGFEDTVTCYLESIIKDGAKETLNHLALKTAAG